MAGLEGFLTNRIGFDIYYRYSGDPAPRGVVVACHGMFSHQGNNDGKYHLLAMEGVRRGFGVMRFDFTGRGRSDGTFIHSTLGRRIQDLEDVVGFMTAESIGRSKPLFVVGSSMGGAVAICFAARHARLLRGLVTWAAPANMAWNMQCLSPTLHARLKNGKPAMVIDHGAEYLFTPGFLADLEQHVPDRDITGSGLVPKLLIHGGRDLTVAPENADRLFAAAPESTRLLRYPDSDHRFLGDEEQLINDTLSFMEAVGGYYV
ncbi:alpha/beta fold hydrolase [bacterium]|nr:alpha/beta fold hydrolase [candidate division CSSED10-310 bacterium]